jgi:hypothetical protein
VSATDDTMTVVGLGYRPMEDGSVRMHISTILFDGITAWLDRSIVIKHGNWIEKNWIPLSCQDDRLRCVYSWNPFIVCTVDSDGTATVTTPIPATDLPTSMKLCGGSGVVVADGHRLAIIHQWARKSGRRLYYNRFIELDDNYHITHISPPLKFVEHNTVEYVAGLVVSGSNLLIPVNVDEKMMQLCSVSISHVLSMLHTVNEWRLLLLDSLG